MNRNVFARGYTAKWSKEIFVISEKIVKGAHTIYRIKDLANESISGTFYPQGLVHSITNDDLRQKL